jgi:hypothetical protein
MRIAFPLCHILRNDILAAVHPGFTNEQSRSGTLVMFFTMSSSGVDRCTGYVHAQAACRSGLVFIYYDFAQYSLSSCESKL